MYSSPVVVIIGSSVDSDVLIPIRSTDEAARAARNVGRVKEEPSSSRRVIGIGTPVADDRPYGQARAVPSISHRCLHELSALPLSIRRTTGFHAGNHPIRHHRPSDEHSLLTDSRRPGPGGPMHLDRQPNDATGERLMAQHTISPRTFVVLRGASCSP